MCPLSIVPTKGRYKTMAQDFSKDIYNSKRWRKNAKAFAESKHWICEQCGRSIGGSSGRYIVHHREHLTPSNVTDDYIVYGWDNLQLLCLDCHNSVHGTGAIHATGLCKFDSNGDVVAVLPHSYSEKE